MSMTERDKKLLVILALVLLIGGFWMFLIKPQREEAAELATKIDSTQKTLQQAKQQLAEVNVNQEQYVTSYSENLEMGQAIPTDDAIPSLMVQLDALSGRSVSFTRLQVPEYPSSLLASSATSASTPGGSQPATPVANTTTTTATTPSGSTTPPTGSTSQTPASTFTPVEVNLQFQSRFDDIQGLFKRIDNLVKVTPGGIDAKGRLLFVQGFRIKQGRQKFPHVAVNIGAFAFSIPASTSSQATQPQSTPVSQGTATTAPTPAATPPAAGGG